MSSLAAQMKGIDASIFDRIGETAVFGSNEFKGIFNNTYKEIEYSNGTIVGLDIAIQTQWQDFMSELVEGDTVTVEDNDYRFIRRIPDKGDESGKVILELGSFTP